MSLSHDRRVFSMDFGLDAPRAGRAVADGAARQRRARMQRALVELAAEHGFARTSVGQLVKRASVSRRTFYELYGGLEGCMIAVLDDGFARVLDLAQTALAQADPGPAGLREALAELLVLLDEEPLLARVWLLESRGAGPRVLAHREQRMAQLREAILACVLPAEDPAPAPPANGLNDFPSGATANGLALTSSVAGSSRLPLAAEGTFAAVLGIIEAHLRERRPGALLELLGPLMGLVVAPYLGLQAARREAELGEQLAARIGAARAAAAAANGNGNRGAEAGALANGVPHGESHELTLPGMLANPSAHRARSCVVYLAAHPGSSNREIADGIGVRGKEQISKLLARLADQRLIAKRSPGKGLANAWQLTTHGERATEMLAGRNGEARWTP